MALDGSRFKAVNNRDKNFTVAKVAKRIEQVEASIARYLAALDRDPDARSMATSGKGTVFRLSEPRGRSGCARIRTAESGRELPDWICVTTWPEVGVARRRRPFAFQLPA